MNRPYLRDLINDHKPTTESNNEENDSDADRAEWKIQLVMQNSCISTRNSEEAQTIYSASKPVEIFMGSDTEGVIDTQEASIDKGSEFIPESVDYIIINIIRAESYIMSPIG